MKVIVVGGGKTGAQLTHQLLFLLQLGLDGSPATAIPDQPALWPGQPW